MHVEDRMVWLGQFVQCEHAENRGERCPENRQFKGNGNKSGPAIERAAADIQRVGDRRSPVLKEKSSNAPRQAAKKRNRRHQVALQAEGFRETVDREGSEGIEAVVARRADLLHGLKEFFRSAELTHHAV